MGIGSCIVAVYLGPKIPSALLVYLAAWSPREASPMSYWTSSYRRQQERTLDSRRMPQAWPLESVALQTLGERKKHININKFAGLSRDWVGAKNLFMCFFRVIPFGGEKTHKQNSPQKSWDNPVKILFTCFFLYVFFFAPYTLRALYTFQRFSQMGQGVVSESAVSSTDFSPLF